MLKIKTAGRNNQSGHSMPKTAINFLKMKKGLYMNETNALRPQILSTTDLSRGHNNSKGLALTNYKVTDIYEQSPVNYPK